MHSVPRLISRHLRRPRVSGNQIVAFRSFSSTKEYSTPEISADAAAHKAGLEDTNIPPYQNPLHLSNPNIEKVFAEDFNSTEALAEATVPVPPMGEGVDAVPSYLHELADEIVHLNMLEMSELINKIADHYGFDDSMLAPDEAVGVDEDEDAEGAAQAEKKTSFDVKLVGFDVKTKIKVIKEVRSIAGLGLKEAKELVEGAPKIIQKDLKTEQADEIKAKLEELGAEIELV